MTDTSDPVPTANKPEAKPASDQAVQANAPIGKWIGLGVGAGIGSAAIAAALLYANRTKKKDGAK